MRLRVFLMGVGFFITVITTCFTPAYSVPDFGQDATYLEHLGHDEKLEFILELSAYSDEKKILNKIRRLKNVDSAFAIRNDNGKSVHLKIVNDVFVISEFLIKVAKIREVQKYDVGPQKSVIFEDVHSLSKYFNLTFKKEGALRKMLPEILALGVFIHFVVREYNIVSVELRGSKEYIEEQLNELRKLESIRAIESTLTPRGSLTRSGGEGGTTEEGGSSAAYCVQIF